MENIEYLLWLFMGSLGGFTLGVLLFLIYLRISNEKRKKKTRKEMNFILNQAQIRSWSY